MGKNNIRITDEQGIETLRKTFLLMGRIPTQAEYTKLNLSPNYAWYHIRFKKSFNEIFIEANKDRYNYKTYHKDIKDKIDKVLKINPNIKFKVCNYCGRYLPIHEDFFHKQNAVESGYTSKCKECEHQLKYENKKGKAGIYKIINKINNKIYVGSTISLHNRKIEHFNALSANTHLNRHLQRAWNKYGEENFVFKVIEYIGDKNKLLEREQYWIDKLKVCDKNIGYNIAPVAGNSLGIKRTAEQRRQMSIRSKKRIISEETKEKLRITSTGKRHTIEAKQKIRLSRIGKPMSEETKKKLSIINKGREGYMKGKVMSEESKKKMRLSAINKHKGEDNPASKLTKTDVIKILKLLDDGVNGVTIANEFNVKKATISSIKHGRNWRWLSKQYYENKDKMIS